MERYRDAPKVTDGAAVKRPKALKETVIPFLQSGLVAGLSSMAHAGENGARWLVCEPLRDIPSARANENRSGTCTNRGRAQPLITSLNSTRRRWSAACRRVSST